MAPDGSSSPGEVPDQLGFRRRSRGGCWTCKRLHKKCDEQRPACRRCAEFQRCCEGYGIRVTWVDPNHVKKEPLRRSKKTSKATSSTDAVVEIPVQAEVAGQLRGLDLRADADGPNSQATEDHNQPYIPTLSSPVADSPILPTSARPDLSAVDSPSEERLLTEFQVEGHLTMCRVLGYSPMLEKIVPLSWRSRSVARVCLAYQAYVNNDYRHQFSHFLEEALELFKLQLQNNDVHADEVLVTGLLLCSVSITAVLLWTTHVQGLEAIIIERGHDDPGQPRDELTQYLVEGVGLLDLPGLTIGRRNPSRHMWQRFITPTRRRGIEPTIGLPRSLIDLMAQMDLPEAESQLLLWTPSDEVEHVLQYHYWEACRLATILCSRALAPSTKPVTGEPSERTKLPCDTESLVMRIFACIHSLRDAANDPFQTPLYLCTMWPMFIAALHTESGSTSRDLLAKEFEAFVAKRNLAVDRLGYAILLEVWTKRELNPALVPFEVAQTFAYDMQVEVHLY